MTGRRSQSLAQLERDAALARVNRVRSWSVAGAAALTAGFAALVSAVAPGHTLGAKSPSATSYAGSRSTPQRGARPQMPPLASAAALGLQAPSNSPQAAPTQDPSQAPSDPSQSAVQAAPAPAPSQAPVVSGGS